jgi:hypothetical protein
VNPLDGLLGVTAWCARGALSLLEDWPAAASLALIGVLTAGGMLWAIRRFSDQAAMGALKRRVRAHLYELRLFADEPALIWRAQRELLRLSLRRLRLMLPPALALALPTLLLLIHLDAFYGHAPLAPGAAAVVTVQMKAFSSLPRLEAPAGVAVETPPVRVQSERQLSWRLRPLREVSGRLRLVSAEGVVEKEIESGQGRRYVSVRRVSSVAQRLRHPGEPRLSGGSIEWIEIRYPPAKVRLGRLELPWLVWFAAVALAAAWLLKDRLGVSV